MSAHVPTGVQTLFTEQVLREIVERIVGALDPQAIILFGSRASGAARHDSDVDLLVITDRLADRSVFERHRAVSDLFPRRRFALDVLVRTPAEMEQLVRHGPRFFRDIVAQGRPLYERRSDRLDSKGGGGLPGRAHSAAATDDSPA